MPRAPRAWKKQLEQFLILSPALKWLVLAVLVGAVAGSASAFFLVLLDSVTAFRESHLWVIALLPFGGFLIGCLYHYFGRIVESGNNLILDEIHDPKSVIPLRMTPMVLLGTLVTHLLGGSAGREGTAVQMGASLADQFSAPLKLGPDSRRILLMSGMSAGFASVFGTPLAGAVFGLEVLSIGRMQYDALLPCFVSAILAHEVALKWGTHHTVYSMGLVPDLTVLGILLSLLAGLVFGAVGTLFSALTHRIGAIFKAAIDYPPLRLFAGGVIVAAGVWAAGTTRFIGLGIPTILESFQSFLPSWDFALKLLFTAITLGAGFKGGEVTPLFFVGATLGNALAHIIPLPFPLLAGMGFVAVFAGAANTPIASTLMAMEIFGSQAGVYAGLACVSAYLISGHAGIYRSQRIGSSKKSLVFMQD